MNHDKRQPVTVHGDCPGFRGSDAKMGLFPSSARGQAHFPKRKRSQSPWAPRRGIAMLAVLIVVTMMSLAGLSFVAYLSAENKAVRAHGDDMQMECILASGQELIKPYLVIPWRPRQDVGGLYDNPAAFHNVQVVDDPTTKRRGWFSIVSPRQEGGEVRGVRFGLENESARLHLGMVLRWELKQPGAGQQALLRLPGMTPVAADSILDWMDTDSQPREFGAEADTYSGRGMPCGPRNGVPASIEELLLIRGVSRDLVFGADANFNHLLDPGEGASYADRLETLESGGLAVWSGLLTVYSAESNLTPEGAARIDLNQPSLARLHRQLSQVFEAPMADFVVAYRQFGPYQGQALTTAVDSIQVDLAAPPKFTFNSLLDLVGSQVRVIVPMTGTYAFLPSPLTTDPAAMKEYLPKLLDYATLEPVPVIVGRVNINLASRVVLECVPGIDEGLAGQIVGMRDPPDTYPTPERSYPTWLYTEGLIDLERMKQLLPYMTTGGDVYRAQIVGYYDRPGPVGRAEVVIDATGRQPRQVYWKDLRIFGRGYPAEVLASPADQETGVKY